MTEANWTSEWQYNFLKFEKNKILSILTSRINTTNGSATTVRNDGIDLDGETGEHLLHFCDEIQTGQLLPIDFFPIGGVEELFLVVFWGIFLQNIITKKLPLFLL